MTLLFVLKKELLTSCPFFIYQPSSPLSLFAINSSLSFLFVSLSLWVLSGTVIALFSCSSLESFIFFPSFTISHFNFVSCSFMSSGLGFLFSSLSLFPCSWFCQPILWTSTMSSYFMFILVSFISCALKLRSFIFSSQVSHFFYNTLKTTMLFFSPLCLLSSNSSKTYVNASSLICSFTTNAPSSNFSVLYLSSQFSARILFFLGIMSEVPST